MTEILEERPRLSDSDRQIILQRLLALGGLQIEETPEMIAAIDDGARSLESGEGYLWTKRGIASPDG